MNGPRERILRPNHAWVREPSAALTIVLIAVSIWFLYRGAFPQLKGGAAPWIYFREIARRREHQFIEGFKEQTEEQRVNASKNLPFGRRNTAVHLHKLIITLPDVVKLGNGNRFLDGAQGARDDNLGARFILPVPRHAALITFGAKVDEVFILLRHVTPALRVSKC